VSRALPRLPVTAVLDEVADALAGPGSAVLVAPPGAGKTTGVPLSLLDAGWRGDGRILVLEPRRLAARASAERMAHLVGDDRVGETVGYRVRGDTRVSARTRIEVVTEGVLPRMLASDPALEGVAAVLFDEFHERSLPADLGLALTLHARRLFRPDLRLLVMSATLDAAPVARLLGDAPVVRSEGRTHPVETRFLDRPADGWIEPHVVRAVRGILPETEGDVLVFLPGAAEIRRTADGLDEAGLPRGVQVHTLHGSLTRADQDRALAPAPDGERKIVLASAIAETSLTIEGVRIVVDSGLMRGPRFDPGTGMTRLETVRVTRDSADQRRGRAGRVAPGVCLRLWTRGEDRGLVPARVPEIRGADLAPVALELAAFGAAPDELAWLDPPPEGAWNQARELLRELDVLGRDGTLTRHGRRVAEIGVHPRLGHLLVQGRAEGRGPVACRIAALLQDRDVLRGEGGPPPADLRLRLEALLAVERGRAPRAGPGFRPHRGGVYRARDEARRLAERLDVHGVPTTEEVAAVGELAALAYPDRVGLARPGAPGRFLLRNGRGAAVRGTDPLVGADALVAVEVQGGGREARIFQAVPLELEVLEARFGDRVETVEEIDFDDEAGRVVARRVRRLGALVLGEAPLRSPPQERIAAALCAGIRGAGLHVLPWDRDTTQLRERLAFLHHLEPEGWPATDDAALLATLETWLAPYLTGMRSLDDLSRVPLGDALLHDVPWPRRARLDDAAPTHLEVPSGSRIRLDYADPAAPVLAVKLQELFGMTETPRIGGGRVPLTVHLLSPARRPVQVTRDLASFWRDTYFDVRKDLRGRYPKHPWPENPLTARPTRRTKRHGG
jgi:ATP-dependent helicase HrpB